MLRCYFKLWLGVPINNYGIKVCFGQPNWGDVQIWIWLKKYMDAIHAGISITITSIVIIHPVGWVEETPIVMKEHWLNSDESYGEL